MSIKFDFDEGAFKKAVSATVNAAMQQISTELQRELDRLHSSHAGKPMDETRRAVHAMARRLGWKATTEELEPYAVAISGGQRIVVKPENIDSDPTTLTLKQ